MDLNIIDFILLALSILILFLGNLVNFFDRLAPAAIRRIYKHGQVAYRISDAEYLNHIELPKSFFRYFYMYAFILSSSCLMYMISVYFFNTNVNQFVRFMLDLLLKNQPPVSVITALTAMTLLTAQCARRLHETIFLQVFAKSSKINILHFSIGFLHYSICTIAVLGASPLFCDAQDSKIIVWGNLNSFKALIPWIIICVCAFYEQHQSNIILANLRKHKDTGKIITDEYRLPFGRFFKYVSSPHRLTEIIIYIALTLIMRTKTFILILIWVFSNQLQGAIGTQMWYKKTFKSYPSERYAIIPQVI